MKSPQHLPKTPLEKAVLHIKRDCAKSGRSAKATVSKADIRIVLSIITGGP